ncbi:inactive ubiquitin carboxyl-terminal hydrolase 54 [Pelomyxa schiedti]|nr:inactive ubiquitin carboxyl-terminal hydrolase 54 [Pelomyxa schiedti]
MMMMMKMGAQGTIQQVNVMPMPMPTAMTMAMPVPMPMMTMPMTMPMPMMPGVAVTSSGGSSGNQCGDTLVHVGGGYVPLPPMPVIIGEGCDKGLNNPFGHNNCFVNVVLQALWHLSSFLLWFEHQHGHFHNTTACVFCALAYIFQQFRISNTDSIPPDTLRFTLHVLFAQQSKFQIGQLEDAAEAYEEIMWLLHCSLRPRTDNTSHLLVGGSKSGKCNPPCLVHSSFGLSFTKQFSCPKCCTPVVQLHESFILYVNVNVLRRYHCLWPDQRLGFLINYTLQEEHCSCPNPRCSVKSPFVQHLMNNPVVVGVGLVWASEDPPASDIEGVLNLIGSNRQLHLPDIFNMANKTTLEFSGMICFWRNHYNCFFWKKQMHSWLSFDDSLVTYVGEWASVQHRCLLGHLHPSVLFYEKN